MTLRRCAPGAVAGVVVREVVFGVVVVFVSGVVFAMVARGAAADDGVFIEVARGIVFVVVDSDVVLAVVDFGVVFVVDSGVVVVLVVRVVVCASVIGSACTRVDGL